MKTVLGLFVACLTVFSMQAHASATDASTPDDQFYVHGALVSESPNRILIMIDGNAIKSLKQLHQIIEKGLKLPASYGENFDALFDVLTDTDLVKKSIDITVISGASLTLNIGQKNVEKLLGVLNDAQDADATHFTTMYW